LPRRALVAAAVAIAALSAIACSPSPEVNGLDREPEDVSSASSAPPVPLPKVILPDGFEVTLELAITPDELAQGLMYRPRLPDDRGMLLIFAEERLPNIWMMNTLVALDIVYLDRSGTVVDIVPDAQPCPAEPCPRFTPKVPAQAVLELPAGGARQHAITEGSKLEFVDLTEFPPPE
jgi:uncharacterized membrane protein (UPF0127 family)